MCLLVTFHKTHSARGTLIISFLLKLSSYGQHNFELATMVAYKFHSKSITSCAVLRPNHCQTVLLKFETLKPSSSDEYRTDPS